MKRTLLALVIRAVDFLGLPLTFLSGFWLVNLRRALHRAPASRWILQSVGVLPVRHHYYEPLVFEKDLRRPLSDNRELTGLNLNESAQLELLKRFDFNDELLALPLEPVNWADPAGTGAYYYHNDWFAPGDAEYLFNMVRHAKPARVIEIGGGFSTLLFRHAIDLNQNEDPGYTCEHLCIEPNENSWLELTGANVLRKKVETVDLEIFRSLAANDIIFIDSSHVIRPQGDVLFEYLELLGTLRPGVLIHVHDVFTPRDYPERWVLKESKLFNEQYLLEAFLSHNSDFKVIGSLNHLWHDYRAELSAVCPILAREPEREPSSFWMVRN